MRRTPRQDQVVEFVASNPGCPKIRAAEHVAPRGSLRYGYQSVNRTIQNGRIVAKRVGGRYELHLPYRQAEKAVVVAVAGCAIAANTLVTLGSDGLVYPVA